MLASPGQSPGSRHIIISSTQTAITRGPQMLSDHARPWLCLCIAVIVTDDVILADIWTGPHFDEYHGNAPRIFDTMLRTDRLLADHRHECEYS